MVQNASTDWSHLFRQIRQAISNDPLPYVTRLSQKKYKSASVRAYSILVATLISLRTRDATTEQASERLLASASTPKQMMTLSESQIARAIYPCGFYKTKAKQIRRFSQIIQNQFSGKVPRTLDELMNLPGVGRKTANLVLTEGYGLSGICVDVHVHRILNRIGLCKTNSPDETELRLREILPTRYWSTINCDLVMFGQYHCKPVRPHCTECSLRKDCQYAAQH